MRTILFILTIALAFVSCTPTQVASRQETYADLYKEDPTTIMLMPPINKSTKIEAKKGLYCSLTIPLADKGYYVMPANLAMEILKEQHAYDSELLINNSMKKVGEVFGVDAVLFTTIHEWRKISVGNLVEVKIQYQLKSTKTDETIYDRTGTIKVSSNANTGNLLADVIVNTINTALTKEVKVGRSCNIYSLSDMPEGKYGTMYHKDGDLPAGKKEFTVRLQN